MAALRIFQKKVMPTLLNTGAWKYVIRLLVILKYCNWRVEATIIIIIIIIIVIKTSD